jgi:hypothetical protein
MGMKSVKLDEEAYQAAQKGKAAGGFPSLSAFLKHVFNLVGLSTFEAVNESQERREMRQKLAEIHAWCKEIRDGLTNIQVSFKPVDLREVGPSLRAVMAVDEARRRTMAGIETKPLKLTKEEEEEQDRLFGWKTLLKE